ncbi:sensor histidine kinase [Streptomyces apocyni]|uniref:sensor histidine kinase n=1 Tax=Streptomyces apocyni TaxID=2654677 RepID=UPI0012EA6713|nr:histidine kinase [Streptomyces apocyni]
MSGVKQSGPPAGAPPWEPPWEGRTFPLLLPSGVAAELDPDRARGGRVRRTLRDWVVDFGCFFVAVILGLISIDTMSERTYMSDELMALDQVIGALACAAIWLRRRWPVGLAVALVVAGVLSDSSGGAGLIALFTVAVHRPFRYVAWIAGAGFATIPLILWLRPEDELPYGVMLAFIVLLTALVIGWGMFVRSRRQLLLSLRDRAQRAETEAALRAEHAQRLAREDIAREMHDVLAHRLTLLSVHAGGLEFRPDAPTAEIARAAGVIRDSAHEALQDLREIIGVLRAGEPADDSGRPQPTLAALDTLVAESRAAGTRVAVEQCVADPAAVPANVGRNAYRIAQEGLTNARKHAPGAPVAVRVAGESGAGLTIEVRNPAPPGDVPKVPGSGQGLIGLTERAALAGGRLEHGTDGAGGYYVNAWLPWGT